MGCKPIRYNLSNYLLRPGICLLSKLIPGCFTLPPNLKTGPCAISVSSSNVKLVAHSGFEDGSCLYLCLPANEKLGAHSSQDSPAQLITFKIQLFDMICFIHLITHRFFWISSLLRIITGFTKKLRPLMSSLVSSMVYS